MNTAARVTYAMGKDNEVPEHFGMLHSDNLTPHRAIWILAVISKPSSVASRLPFPSAMDSLPRTPPSRRFLPGSGPPSVIPLTTSWPLFPVL